MDGQFIGASEKMDKIKKNIFESISLKNEILEQQSLIISLNKVSDTIIKALKNGKKILIAGNGGSAADSQHFAAELVSKFYKSRKAFRAIALTTDTSIITSIGNDFEFNYIFERQIEALGDKGDVFLGITTSGKSKNVINALKISKEMEIISIVLTGNYTEDLLGVCDLVLSVPSSNTPRIQEVHLLFEHIICELVEDSLS